MKRIAKKPKLEVKAQTIRVLTAQVLDTAVVGGMVYPCSGAHSGCIKSQACVTDACPK